MKLLAAALALALGVLACSSAPPPAAPSSPAKAAAPYQRSGKPGRFVESLDVSTFQRGNLHTHSTKSDGDSPPEAVYAWYREHGYNFLALSDHNRLTDPASFANEARPDFALVSAEEVTMKANTLPVHVNAICHKRAIGGKKFDTTGEALAWAVARIHEQGGVALVNHPNFHYAFGADALAHASGAALLEIWSGHPNVHAEGDASHPSEEVVWETALGAGLRFAGVAVDDMHRLGAARDAPVPGPGRGWVEVFADRATVPAICDALRRGRLYASNGVRLSRIRVAGDAFEVVAVAPGGHVEFLGQGGVVLERQPIVAGEPHIYRLGGGEAWVRARVTAKDGLRAWTQPYFVE